MTTSEGGIHLKELIMYAKIKEFQEIGLNKAQTARNLDIDYKTVRKYWDMSPEQYAQALAESKQRKKKLDTYESEILAWIRKYRDISSAQVYDWLEEKHATLPFKERTLRQYVNTLRVTHDLPKILATRQYSEIPELPMGHQAQVDLGEIWLQRRDKSRVKAYCFAMVLAHSRYKFVYWTLKPFTGATFVEAHQKAFEFYGGRPKEIAYDQDRVMVVSENHGDIIYTEAFQNYLNNAKFKVHLCRAYDPESKGKIEAVVKYAKYNFAKNRLLIDIDSFNEDCIKWLHRRGNGKVHETTKKVPAKVFALEKEHLLPIPTLYNQIADTDSVSYTVRKSNVVFYKQNRYQVPIGTYSEGKEVELLVNNDHIELYDQDTKELIIAHPISKERGALIGDVHDKERKAKRYHRKEIFEKTLTALKKTKAATDFLMMLEEEKPRHFKEQCLMILHNTEEYPEDLVEESLTYCIKREFYSAGMLKDTLKYLDSEKKRRIPEKKECKPFTYPTKYPGLKPQIRDINEYLHAMKEGEGKWKN